MAKRIAAVALTLCLVFALALSCFAVEENLPSVQKQGQVTDARGYILNTRTGERYPIKIILNYGTEVIYIDVDGRSYNYDRSATVATFSTMSDTEIPTELTDEEIREIFGDEYDIDDDPVPVIAITGFDIMKFAENLHDRLNPESTTADKAGEYTITGSTYTKSLLVDLICAQTERYSSTNALLRSFSADLVKAVREFIAENNVTYQAELTERIAILEGRLASMEEGTEEYQAVADEIAQTNEKLEEAKTNDYKSLTRFAAASVLDISMNAKARALLEELGEDGKLELYLAIAGLEYTDETVLVNTHPSDEQTGLDAILEAEENGTTVTQKQIPEIFDECSVVDTKVVPAIVQPDGTVEEIGINEMDTVELEEDEELQPRMRTEIVQTSPFILLMRIEPTCVFHWWWLLLLLLLLHVLIEIILNRRDRRNEEAEEAALAAEAQAMAAVTGAAEVTAEATAPQTEEEAEASGTAASVPEAAETDAAQTQPEIVTAGADT